MTDSETVRHRQTTDTETWVRTFKERDREGENTAGGESIQKREREQYSERRGGEEGPVQFH